MWSKIPNLQGVRAAKNWLRVLAPDRQERVRRNYDQGVRRIKRALGQDRELLRTFQTVVEHARLFGRVDGLREGLELYEYGTRIQKKNPAVFQTIMKFVARCAGLYEEGQVLAGAISAERVCDYLDREIERTKQVASSIKIGPPEDWGDTWKSALKKKGSNVHKLISQARKEGLSERFSTLMAWKTWCKEIKPKRPVFTRERYRNDRVPERSLQVDPEQ